MDMQYRGQTIKIPIGTRYWDGVLYPVYYPIRRFGVNLILAKSRVGKSAIAKEIAVKISKFRKVAIFDVYGEWKSQVTEFNWKTELPDAISGLKIIDNFGFYISELDNVGDWASLGFTGRGAQIMHLLASCVTIHKDELEAFSKLVGELPRDTMEFEMFRRDYIPNFPSKIHVQTWDAIQSTWYNVKNLFIDINDKEKTHVEDWVELFKENDHLLISLNLKGESEIFKAQVYVGKILEQWIDHLTVLKPLLIFEEADFIFPNVDEYMPTSLELGIQYAVKLQKFGVCMIIICQSEDQLSRGIAYHAHNRILGQLPIGSRYSDETKDLKWDYERNIRQFLMIDIDNKHIKFYPNITSCEVGI